MPGSRSRLHPRTDLLRVTSHVGARIVDGSQDATIVEHGNAPGTEEESFFSTEANTFLPFNCDVSSHWLPHTTLSCTKSMA